MEKCWFKPPPVLDHIRQDYDENSIAVYSTGVFKILDAMRIVRRRTDATLLVGTEETGTKVFHAHRLVLAAASHRFREAAIQSITEGSPLFVNLPKTTPATMSLFLDSVYTAPVNVDHENVLDLLSLAQELKAPRVIEQCYLFIGRNLDPSNALRYATCQVDSNVAKVAKNFVAQHFSQVSRRDEFLLLAEAQLSEILHMDNLNVADESEVYNALVRWVRADRHGRYFEMGLLLQAVRCQVLSPEFLQGQIDSQLAADCRVRHYLRDILAYRWLVKQGPRLPNTRPVIFVVGGYTNVRLDLVDACDVDDGCWMTVAKLAEPGCWLGAAWLKCVLYVIGLGRTGEVAKYDPLRNTWEQCSRMPFARSKFGVAVLDGYVYVVGGSASRQCYSRVDRFDPRTDAWVKVASMNNLRERVATAVLKGCVFALGGQGSSNLPTRSTERYVPELNSWVRQSDFRTARSNAAAAGLGEHVYLAGGYGDGAVLSTVEKFNPARRTWEVVESMNEPRYGFTLTAVDGKLRAVGGFGSGDTRLDTVEVYDPVANKWSSGPRMAIARGAHSAALAYLQCARHTD